MDELAAAFADFEALLDDLPSVATDERIKSEWREAMVVYGPAAIAAIANSRAIVVDNSVATPSMMAPIIWCCGRPDKERDTRWVGHSLLGVLVHHDPLALDTLRWMLDRPEWILRATALESLRSDHPAALIRELVDRGLNDRHRFVRSMASHMIYACEQRPLLPRLREAASRERLDWLREGMEDLAMLGERGFNLKPDNEHWIKVQLRENLDGRVRKVWWSVKREVYEEGGIDRILREHYGRRNPSPQPQPLPPKPPQPIAPWLLFSDRPMGYLFMNRLEGPDVVQVLKARHGVEGDGKWPPL
ncbi:MAG: hypothetical protein RIE32_03725 [Phycisphaerales bacterium]